MISSELGTKHCNFKPNARELPIHQYMTQLLKASFGPNYVNESVSNLGKSGVDNIPLLERLVDGQELGTLIGFDVVPRGGV